MVTPLGQKQPFSVSAAPKKTQTVETDWKGRVNKAAKSAVSNNPKLDPKAILAEIKNLNGLIRQEYNAAGKLVTVEDSRLNQGSPSYIIFPPGMKAISAMKYNEVMLMTRAAHVLGALSSAAPGKTETVTRSKLRQAVAVIQEQHQIKVDDYEKGNKVGFNTINAFIEELEALIKAGSKP
ncbi:MAG: hypothetical protein NTZ10_04765 [Candidatus Saganbacteria bacterium]|nr:hypothetical protein [Candidatus Saganbacteria bacterium]